MRLCKDPKNTGQAYFVPYLSVRKNQVDPMVDMVV